MEESQFNEAIEKIKHRDREGLRLIYEAYVTYIYQIVLRILQNREDAEDVTTEFFLHLWDIAPSFKVGGGHRTWLTTVARNLAIDTLRKRNREIPISDEPDPEDDGGGLEENLARAGAVSDSNPEREAVETVSMETALQCLRDCERQIVTMKILGELTFQEISDVLKVPMGTVTWQYRNAMAKLKRCGYE